MSPSENFNIDKSRDAEVKEYRKKMRNRQSAQRARDRQKARMRFLEREVALLTLKNQALYNENLALRKMTGNEAADRISGTFHSTSDHKRKKEVESLPLQYSRKIHKSVTSEQILEFGVFPFRSSYMTLEKTSKIPNHPSGASTNTNYDVPEPTPQEDGHCNVTETRCHLSKSPQIEKQSKDVQNKDTRMFQRNSNNSGIEKNGEVELFHFAWTNHLFNSRSPSGNPLLADFPPRFLVHDSQAFEDGGNTMTPRTPWGIGGFADQGMHRALLMHQRNAMASIAKQGNAWKASPVNSSSLHSPLGGLMPSTSSATNFNLFSAAPLLLPYPISQVETKADEEIQFRNQKRHNVNRFDSESSSRMSSESDISTHSS